MDTGSNSSLNTHAAMTPELMRDIRQRVQGMRQWVRMSHLDSDKQPNLILSGRNSRGGSFVKQQQAAFLRSSSQSSSQSSGLNSPTSNRSSSLWSPTSPKRTFSLEEDPKPSSPIHLPRIPSKTLKERGNLQGDIIRNGDVTKRSGAEMPDDDGVRKVRRLSSQESQRSSWSASGKEENPAGNSVKKTPSNASEEVVLRRKIQQSSALHRQDAVTSVDKTNMGTGSRPASAGSRKDVSVNSSRPSSSHSVGIASQSTSRPSSSSQSELNFSLFTPRENGKDAFGRQDSNASEKSAGRKSQKGGYEERRSSVGSGAKSSRRGSQGSESSTKSNRHPSFHTIQGSSTPVLQRHSKDSSSASSSPRSLPPAPLNLDPLPDSLGQASALPLPSPPPMLSSPPPTLPSPPPTPPASLPPPSPPPPVTEEQELVSDGKAPLFQPRPPSFLSADPLPTPPPTPNSASDGLFQTEELPLPVEDLPSPPLPSPPPMSGGLESASTTNDQDGKLDLDIFNFLPDSLPHDDIEEGRKTIKVTTGTDISKVDTDGVMSEQTIQNTTEVTEISGDRKETSRTKTETTVSTTSVTSSFSGQLEQESEERKTESSRSMAPPVIHFPPPPDYSPPLSPTLQSTRESTSSTLLSPTSPFTPNTESSAWDSEHRLTSTSTDVVLGYLDNALELYASSAPPTPTPVRSTPPLTIADLHHDQPSVPPPEDVKVQTTVPKIVTDFSTESQSSSSSNNALTAASSESLEKKEKFSTTVKYTPVESMASFLDVHRLQIEKKKKGGKPSRRKPKPTQVTKYEGSVKTMRKSIKPGTVGELREFFIKQDDDEDETAMWHGKRRMSRPVRSDSSDDDGDARSGYTTNSSDNEYDLVQAEQINSPDSQSPSSPFANEYSLNWEKERASSSLNTSSGQSTPKAKESGEGYVFDKEISPPHSPETNFTAAAALSASNRGTVEAENAPIPSPASLHADSILPHTMATQNSDSFSVASPLPSLGMQQAENKGDDSVQAEGGKAKEEEISNTFATTSLFHSQQAVKTRSSSSESESSDGEKDAHLSDILSSSTDTKKDFRSKVTEQDKTAQYSLTLTGFREGDSNSAPSRHDSGGDGGGVATETGPLLHDRAIMMDAGYAAGDSSSLSAKVTGALGLTEEVEITLEGVKGEEHGVTTREEGDDPTTTYRPNDHNKNDRTSGEGKGSSTTVIHVGNSSYDFPTSPSSVTSGLGGLERDSSITQAVTAQGAGPSQRRETLGFSQTSSRTFSHREQSTAKSVTPPPPDRPSSEAGPADFLSILDDIQLGSDGPTISADTAQRARQLHGDDSKKAYNRNSVEVPDLETVHTDKTQATFTLSDVEVNRNSQDVSSVPAVLDGEATGEKQSSTVLLSNLDVFSREENSGSEVNGIKSNVTEPEPESGESSETFSSTLKFSQSPINTTVTVPETNTVFTDHSESTKITATQSNDDNEENDEVKEKMASVVSELSSVHIGKKSAVLSRSKSSSVSSAASSSSLSSQGGDDNEAMFSSSQINAENAGEVFVYRDSRGDMYVMQDITDQTETSAATAPTTAILKTADDDVTPGQTNLDLHRLSVNESVKVDTKDVDVKKAREVISAFFTDGSSSKPMERRSLTRKQFTLSNGDDSNAVFKVVAGNLGSSGAGQSYSSALYHTDLASASAADQQRQEAVTVSTTSTAVVEEQSELKIHIPKNAVPVLPILPQRLNSTETNSDITPMVMDSPIPPLLAPISDSILTTRQEPYSYSSHFSSSSSDPHTAYDTESGHRNQGFTSPRILDTGISGINFGHSGQDFESESRLEDRTYTSRTTLERSFPDANVPEANKTRSIDVKRLRKPSGSSLSSDDDHGSKRQYRVTRLARTDSDHRKDGSYSTESTLKLSRPTFGSGRFYDSMVSLPNNERSHVTVINNANTSQTNMSFGENDSQYGSQTSKTTSAGDMSPTDEQLYRIVRADKSYHSPTSPIGPASPPAHENQVIRHTLDRKTCATANYEQRELNSSQEAMFRQTGGNRRTSDSWRMDNFSRSEPELSLSPLNKSFATLPRHEEEVGAQKYRLVRTGYHGQRVRSSSSESDDDSGVDGGKRYRAVSRVQVHGSKKRSNSTGSMTNAELSLPPHSSSQSSREYRVSKVQPQSEWEERQVGSVDTRGDLYRVSRVLSSEDLPQDVQQSTDYPSLDTKATYRSWSSLRDVGDENNNKSHPSRVMQTLPTEKTPTMEEQVFRRSNMSRTHAAPKLNKSFDDGFPYISRPLSLPPRSFSPDPTERHRTVINLKVNDDKILPTTHYTETEGQQYKVMNIRSSDDNQRHNQSFSSPVSGYESDTERTNTTNSRMEYRISSPLQQGSTSSPRNISPPPGDKRYVINSTQSCSTLEEGISVREFRPRVASPVQSPTGEWHKTTIDIHCNPKKKTDGKTQRMSPLQQQQSKSYVVFNSLDNIHDDRYNLTSTQPPLGRSNSQTFTSDHKYRVMSPTPTTSSITSQPLTSERHYRVMSPTPTTSSITSQPLTSERHFRVMSPTPTTSSITSQPPASERHYRVMSPTLTHSSSNSQPLLSERHYRVMSPTPTHSSFNSQPLTSERHNRVMSPTPTYSSSNSHTLTSERQYRVMSPTPSSTDTFRGFLPRDLQSNFNTRTPSTKSPKPHQADDDLTSFSQEIYEEKTYEVCQDTGHLMPEMHPSGEEKDLRVLRGKILIQNRLDDSRDHDDFLDNMNVFDTSFHLGKDNPLYQSDPDIYKSLEAELQQQEDRSKAIGQEVTQDITWETVDRIAKKHQSGEEVDLSPKPRRKQNLSTMLLSKLASIDSKDLRQHIDVQHHHEEIYGDIHLVHADGSKAASKHTSNFDSVNENVELMLKEGKAFVIIKVIAERIVPIDYEFNVWRKSQAIVTRNIEIDLHATAQRRRLYEHMMDTGGRMPGALEAGGGGGDGATMRATRRSGQGEEERQLTSLETLRLFSQILEVAEGKGDAEDTEVRTQQEMGRLTGALPASSMDLLY